MKTFKNYILSVFSALCVCCVLCSGCQSVPKDPQERAEFLQDSATDVRDVAEITVIAVLIDNPNSKVDFETAVFALKEIEAADVVSVQMVINILLSLELEELKSPEVQLYVKGGTIAIRRLTRKLDVENPDEVKILAKALREGIEAAIK